MQPLPLTSVYDDLPDPRWDTENKPHRLTDVLVITTCALPGGAESWDAIADYGRTKEAFFRRFLPLEYGVPSPDTFARVFAELDPAAFARATGRWMAAACEAAGLTPVAIDGKLARAAELDTATGCSHKVAAWSAENRVVLGATSVADGSNEIAAIPEPLRALNLAGAIVTIDAAGCQVENARIIRQRKGHYLLAAEGDRPALRAAVEGIFERACATNFARVRSDGHEVVDDGHGRHEERDVAVIRNPAGLRPGWPEPAAVVQVNRRREVGGEGVHTSHYCITSHAGTAAELAGLIRGHWGIENGLHRTLDVVFREDRSRISEGLAGTDLALIRRVAVAQLRRAPGKGCGVAKRLKAGCDDEYLFQALQGIPATKMR